jgi:hypothetical protein
MPSTMAARAETSPAVVNVHLGLRLATLLVEMPDSRGLLAVLLMFWPNIGHCAKESSARAFIATIIRAAGKAKLYQNLRREFIVILDRLSFCTVGNGAARRFSHKGPCASTNWKQIVVQLCIKRYLRDSLALMAGTYATGKCGLDGVNIVTCMPGPVLPFPTGRGAQSCMNRAL